MEGKKILIVDDEGYIGDLLIDFLALENMSGIKSLDFSEAVEKAASDDFDLIIADVNIGNDSIEDFIDSLKRKNILTPVALMTGDHRVDDQFASRTGAVGIIYKPFQVAPFLTSVREFLEKK
jgi:DNA-binding NtrC family response regulator